MENVEAIMSNEARVLTNCLILSKDDFISIRNLNMFSCILSRLSFFIVKLIALTFLLISLFSKAYCQISPPAASEIKALTINDTTSIRKYALIENKGGYHLIHTEKLMSAKEIADQYNLANDFTVLTERKMLLAAIILLIAGILGIYSNQLYKRYYSKYVGEYYWAEKVEASAIAKLHTVKNNYSVFRYLLETNKNDLARQFADKSAHYFAYSLRTWNDGTKWTVAQEVELLHRFYAAQRIIQAEVTIKIDISPSLENAVFIPEVFPTLLENSMQHAFKGVDGERIFTIYGRNLGSIFIQFTIIDNGKSSPLSDYFSERKSAGLAILKRRLIAEFKRNKIPLKDVNPLRVEVNRSGTVINILFPL